MVKRYRKTVYGHEENSWTEMQESEHGSWVYYADYTAIAERCERLEAALRTAAGYLDDVQDAGPPGCGYKSDGLEALLRDITVLLPNSGGCE